MQESIRVIQRIGHLRLSARRVVGKRRRVGQRIGHALHLPVRPISVAGLLAVGSGPGFHPAVV